MDQSSHSFTPLLELEFKPIEELITNLRIVRLSRSNHEHTNVWSDVLSILRDQCANHGIDPEFVLSRDLIVISRKLFGDPYLRLKPIGWPIEGILIGYEIFSSCPEVWEIGELLDEDPRPDELSAIKIDSASINEDIILNTFQEKITGNSSITLEEFRSNFPKLHSVFKPWVNSPDQQPRDVSEISPNVGAKCIAVMDCLKTSNFDQQRVHLIQSLESEEKKRGFAWPLNLAMRNKKRGYFEDPWEDFWLALTSFAWLLIFLPIIVVLSGQGPLPPVNWISAIQSISVVMLSLVIIVMLVALSNKFSGPPLPEDGTAKFILGALLLFVALSISAWIVLLFSLLIDFESLPLSATPWELAGTLLLSIGLYSIGYILFTALLGKLLKPLAPLLMKLGVIFGVLTRFILKRNESIMVNRLLKTFGRDEPQKTIISIKNTVDVMYGLSVGWYVSDVIANRRRPVVDYEELQRVFCYELRFR